MRVEVVEFSSAVLPLPLVAGHLPPFGRGLPDPDLLAAEDECVDAEADFGWEAEEFRACGVAGHDFVLGGGHGAAGVEEVGVEFAHFVELAVCEYVGVFAVVFGVPLALSADHGCCGDGVWSVGLGVGS